MTKRKDSKPTRARAIRRLLAYHLGEKRCAELKLEARPLK